MPGGRFHRRPMAVTIGHTTAGGKGDMRARTLPLAGVTATDADRWQRLADRAVEPNACLDPRFLLPARDFGDRAADVTLVAVEDGDDWAAVVALTRAPVWRGFPLTGLTTEGRFMSVYADRRHPLVAPERTVEALGTLLDGVEAAHLPGFLELTALPLGGPLGTALSRLESVGRIAVETRRTRSEAYALSRAGGQSPTGTHWPAVVDPEHLAAKARGKFRQAGRALEREAGGPLVVRDASGDPAAVERFLDLQMSGWKADREAGGAALRLDPAEESWFRDVVAAFTPRRDVLTLELLAGETVVYSTLVLVSGGAVFGFLDTYEGSLARLGPGTLGRLAVGDHLAHRPGLAFFDPGLDPRAPAAARLYPDRRDLVDVLVAVHGVLPRAAVRALPAARRLKSAVLSRGRRSSDAPVADAE